jgi:hypothetical protein
VLSLEQSSFWCMASYLFLDINEASCRIKLLSCDFIFRKQLFIVISGLKIIGHGNRDNNLESHRIMNLYERRTGKPLYSHQETACNSQILYHFTFHYSIIENTWTPDQSLITSLEINKYSKPSFIRLQLIRLSDNSGRNMKNAVHTYQTHGIYDGRWVTCLFRQNLRQFLETCIITLKRKYNFSDFYQWINVFSFYTF